MNKKEIFVSYIGVNNLNQTAHGRCTVMLDKITNIGDIEKIEKKILKILII